MHSDPLSRWARRAAPALRALVPLALVVTAPAEPAPARGPGSDPGAVPAACQEELLAPVPFERVRVTDGFFAPRMRTARRVTIPACLDRCEETGRIANFRRAGGLEEGPHQGRLYNDSDVYKVLEGAAYALALEPDAELRARAGEIVTAIAAAQTDDGYLNTYVQLVDEAGRWANVANGHELYCAGHLIEAGVAWKHATGDETLLGVATRLAERIAADFGPKKRLDPPGHQELELALVKLARETGEARWAELARFFLEQRGSERGRKRWGEYWQDHAPVWDQLEAVGHAVRALYMYCAMTDVAAATGDPDHLSTLLTLWEDVARRKRYVTGGVGSSAANEGFSAAYELPNETAYCETCAAYGMVLWSHRMFLLTRHATFADAMERALYNNLLAGVSESGDRFFYDNPLESRGDHHRVPWFDCSCCPSNVARALPSLGERIWAADGDDVYLLLYVASEAELELAGGAVKLSMTSGMPWSGEAKIRVRCARPVRFTLHLRVPGWTSEISTGVNGLVSKSAIQHGDDPGTFLRYERVWKDGDEIDVELPLVPHRVRADERVAACRGRVALQRGPLVYALEGCDHGGAARHLVLPPGAELTALARPELLSGVTVVRAKGLAVEEEAGARVAKPALLTAIPYFLWDEREPGEMVVWIPETPELAALTGVARRRAGDALVRASHCWRQDTVVAVADGVRPSASDDHAIPRHTFWDHRGTEEWLEQRFDAPRRVSESAVYWFDDLARGGCRVPAAWSLSWSPDGESWRPVERLVGERFETRRDAFNVARFEPVDALALRLDVRLQPEFSAGVLEWVVGPLAAEPEGDAEGASGEGSGQEGGAGSGDREEPDER